MPLMIDELQDSQTNRSMSCHDQRVVKNKISRSETICPRRRQFDGASG